MIALHFQTYVGDRNLDHITCMKNISFCLGFTYWLYICKFSNMKMYIKNQIKSVLYGLGNS